MSDVNMNMLSGIAEKAKLQAQQAKLKMAGTRAAGNAKGVEQVEKAAEDFEAVFLSQMLEHMFADTDLLPMSDGPGEDVYKSMLVEEYGKLIARSGGIGVADHVKREMLRLQEEQS